MVPVTSYYEEETKSNLGISLQTMFAIEEPLFVPKGNYQMDHNTLWFIANGGVMRGAKPQGYRHDGQRPYKPLSTGPCFECGGDHWVGDCPNQKNRPGV